MRTYHYAFIAAAACLHVGATAAPEKLLPNGFKGLAIGTAYSATMRFMQTQIPDAEWECEVDPHPPYKGNVRACRAANTAGSFKYGGTTPSSISLEFDSGKFVSARLFYMDGSAVPSTSPAEAFEALKLALSDVSGRQFKLSTSSDGVYTGTLWGADSYIYLRISQNHSHSSFSYTSTAFFRKYDAADAAESQKSKGL
jgi:hypothetical protein